MTLVQHHGPDRVEFGQGKQVDILDDKIHEEAKMPSAFNASVDVVSGCDRKQVVDFKFQAVEYLSGIFRTNIRNLKAS